MSEVKVNKISPRTACGTVTLGDSGDTFTIPSGATITNAGTATGFGGTGVVSWDTGSIKTTGFTAVTGTGYFCNTTGGAFTVTLPLSPSAGDVVGVSDYAKTFDTDKLTLGRNSSNIGGVADDAILGTEGIAVTLVYVDGTKGWIVTYSGNQTDAPGPVFVAATGGCITTCGDYKTHTFLSPNTFCVTSAGNSAGSDSVDYLIVAGGAAGGGKNNGGGVGGGGAGGIRIGTVCQPSPISPSPLIAPGKSVSVQGYAVIVGGGGACSTNSPSGTAGTSGDTSSALCFSAAGGGGGNDAADNGTAGGSGGGGGEASGVGGAGNTPVTNPAQGNNGGTGNSPSIAGGGGGFTAVGESSEPPCTPTKGRGGAGIDAGPIFGTAKGDPGGNFGGGGGSSVGGPGSGPTYPGGVGGGGIGNAGPPNNQASASGVANTGGGGGGHGSSGAPQGGTNGGGSGIVIIRYKFQ